MNARLGISLVLAVGILCVLAGVGSAGSPVQATEVGPEAGAGVTSGAGVASGGDVTPEVSVSTGNVGVAHQAILAESNQTERHRNPDEYAEDGDDDAVDSWLGGWLGGTLGDSTVEISEGEYETARELLGDDYDDRMEQFVEVRGETEAGESLNQTQSELERFIELLEAFEETEAAYEDALEAGDAEQARAHARDLVEIAAELDGISRDLDALLEEIEELLGVDLTDAKVTIDEITTERQTAAETVATAEFEETELTVEAVETEISFLNPLDAVGQLRTVDGEPVANESIELVIAGEEIVTETDSEGAFSVTYRPVELSLETEELAVEYVPGADTPYRGSETTVDVSVVQVEPEMALTTDTETARFGDEIGLNATLDAEGVAVDDVPLSVTVGGEALETLSVSAGSVSDAVVLPKTVPAGAHELTVQLPFEDQALAGVTATLPLEVREAATELTTSATVVTEPNDDTDGQIRVDGTLVTEDEVALGGESVEIALDGAVSETVETTENGTFEETLNVTTEASGVTTEASDVTVSVSYDGTGNLAPSEAETVVSFASPPGEGRGLPSSMVLAVVVLGGVSLLGGVGWWYRRRNRAPPEPTTVDDRERGVSEEQPATDAVEETAVTESLLKQARDQLQSGHPDEAIQTGYAAVRQRLGTELSTPTTLTHREFYRTYRDEREADDDTVDALRTVTGHYERAAYSPTDFSTEEAEETLTDIRQLCKVDTGA